jgi:hypothetical protein
VASFIILKTTETYDATSQRKELSEEFYLIDIIVNDNYTFSCISGSEKRKVKNGD